MKSEVYIPQTLYLKNIIRSIWQVSGLTTFKNETIIPKGVVEAIFNFGEDVPVQAKLENNVYQLPKCFVNGFNTFPIKVQLPKLQIFFGVQFHPVAVKNLLGAPACEFANLAVDLSLLNPTFNSLWHILIEKRTFAEKVKVITDWIEKRIIPVHPQERLLNSFLENNNQITSVAALAKNICYSQRHLSRKIHGLTKMNTEEFLLYKKYLYAMQLIHHTDLTLTEISYRSHFTDQSHFIRSFRSFAQITPGEYKQYKSFVPGHIFENVR